jgi:hypothetical protein
VRARTRSRFNIEPPGSMLLGTACLLVLTTVTSCAPDAASASSAAQGFHRAVGASDWSAACALLQPKTREKIAEQDSGSCEAGLEALQLPEAGPLMKTEAYGREALVEFDNDAVFVAVSASGWQITAAGCSPQGESPYSCEVGGK